MFNIRNNLFLFSPRIIFTNKGLNFETSVTKKKCHTFKKKHITMPLTMVLNQIPCFSPIQTLDIKQTLLNVTRSTVI